MTPYTIITLLIILTLSAGCLSPQPVPKQFLTTPTIPPTPEPTEVPTEEPTPDFEVQVENTDVPAPFATTAIPTATPFPVETYDPSVTETPTPFDPVTMETPEPIPTVVTNIGGLNFTQFKNNDFFIDIPNDWEIVSNTEPYVNNRIQSSDVFKDVMRLMEFHSIDRNVTVTVGVYDYLVPGKSTLNQDIVWARNEITNRYNVDGYYHVLNYKYYVNERHINVVRFDVVVEDITPYTEMTFVTYEHLFIFRFSSADGLDKYSDLREHIFNSVKTQSSMSREIV